MQTSTPQSMHAVTIDRFGGPETLHEQDLPLPEIGEDDVLVKVEVAGIGEWDPFEREGGFAQVFGKEPHFPYVLGSEGAGVVAAVGSDVTHFRVGQRVYAAGFLNPKGGFYAQYAAVPEELVSRLPDNLTVAQAGVMSGVGVTALRGIDDVLRVKSGDTVMIVGASGGVGHMALQLAKRRGARVLAVASGPDGVALAKRLGADAAVDGKRDDVRGAAREFAPEGVDAVLLTAGGRVAEDAMCSIREGGRAAYPEGVEPVPAPRAGVRLNSYNGDPDPEILERLNRAIEAGPFEVHIGRSYTADHIAEAHDALRQHHLGKLALRM